VRTLVINLMVDLQKEFDVSFLFIAPVSLGCLSNSKEN